MKHPSQWRLLSLALLFGVLAQAPAGAQKPTPTGTQELVAMLELDGVGATPGQLAAASEELRAQLLHSGRLRVVDRQQIDALLKEQAFQQTGCTSRECAVQVGKMLGVRKIVTGRITRIDKALWQAAAQIVDVESGETLRAETVNQRGAFDALLGEGLTALTGKLTGGAAPPTPVAPSAAARSEDPYLKGLAEHLRASGAIFYGASWCPHCRDQADLFGPSADRLPYVDCSPNGPNAPSAPVCLAQDVRTYPTWTFGTERHAGMLSVEELAQRTGYPARPISR